MIDLGYERNLLLSHDVGTAAELRYYGGRGFVHLAESFLPRLRNLGIPDSVLNTITVENPRRLLAMEVQEDVRGSVAALGVEAVAERATIDKPLEIVNKEIHDALVFGGYSARGMRRHKHVGHVPQETVRLEWLGLEDVKGRAVDPGGCQGLD